ncbi:MAG: DoxX family protein [Gammaproteobacteria bacterium]|nr:DoxX family protein [Gammaproteobacteria bacterium]
MKTLFARTYNLVFSPLNSLGHYLPAAGLRLLLAYEFWESGIEKLHGTNWFGDIYDKFPFPLNLLSTDLNWFLATWSELLGATALVLGLATRFSSITLIFVTVIAWITSHPGGYSISNGGYKLPLIYVVMLLPLLFCGPGKLSLDHLISRKYNREKH